MEYETASIFTVERSRNCEELFSRFYRRLTMMDRRLRCGNVVCSDKKSRNGDSIRCCVSRDGAILSPPCPARRADCTAVMWDVRASHNLWPATYQRSGHTGPFYVLFCPRSLASNRSLNPVLIENVTVLIKGKEVVDEGQPTRFHLWFLWANKAILPWIDKISNVINGVLSYGEFP